MTAASRFIRRRRHAGAVAIELAGLMVLFCMMVFGILEVARMLFLWNTMSAVTRRGAAAVMAAAPGADHSDALNQAAFGGVPLTSPTVDGSYLQVTYLNAAREAVATPPVCPSDNVVTCMTNPGDASCVRYVRVRLCQPGGGDTCDPVPVTPLAGVTSLLFGNTTLYFPTFQTVTPVGALGYQPGGCP
jgi:Flp pilus assembly protein TadG